MKIWIKIKSFIKKFFDVSYSYLKSFRFIALIIFLLILVYFLGLIIPQKLLFNSKIEYLEWVESGWMNRALDFIGFTDIYVSPLTILLLVFFFLSLTIVTLNRVPLIMKKAYLRGEPPSFSLLDLKKDRNEIQLSSVIESSLTTNRIKVFLKKRRWSIIMGKEENTFIAIRNRLSPIGFLIFHLSFLLCLIGAILITYTRFSGKLALTEGQLFDGDMRQFHSISRKPKIFKEIPPLGIKVEKVHPYYENDIPTELVVDLQVKYLESTSKEVLRINEPVKKGLLSIMAEKIGISPLFVIRNASGEVIDGVYVSLNVLRGDEDSFQLNLGSPYTFYVRFFPDYVVEDGVETTRSLETNNPALHLVVQKDIRTVYDGTIKLGENAEIDSYTITFEDLRYWVDFFVVREFGRMPLIAGFIFASIGLIMRLVFYQRRLRLVVEYTSDKPLLYIDGRSEFFRISFKDDLKKIVKELESYLNKVEK